MADAIGDDVATMPELPEVTALARSLDTQLRGAVIASVSMRSVAALKTFDPPPAALRGLRVVGCARFGKFVDLQCAGLDLVVHMVLPVTSLAILSIAGFSRFMRSSMLEVLHQDYIRTARAKGLSGRVVNYKHALRNAILPIITLVALQIPQLVSGAIITEGIFSWPGMGLLAFQATVDRDYPVILGVVMLVAVLTVFFNLLADLSYAVVDPRIRY